VEPSWKTRLDLRPEAPDTPPDPAVAPRLAADAPPEEHHRQAREKEVLDNVVAAAAALHRHQSPVDQTVRGGSRGGSEKGDTDEWAKPISQREKKEEEKKEEMESGRFEPTKPAHSRFKPKSAVALNPFLFLVNP
jgi:hypothetical protein